MIFDTLIAMLVIFGLLAGWLGVQHIARRYAERHPEHGPAREEGGSCFFCLCKSGEKCDKRELLDQIKDKTPTTL